MVRWILGQVLRACVLLGGIAGASAQTAVVHLDDKLGSAPVWHALRVLADPGQTLGLQEVMIRNDQFEAPTTAYGTLGMAHHHVWLHIPLNVAPSGDGLWVLDIDYPVLNHIEMYLTQGTQVVKRMQQGNLEPYENRVIQGRAHSFGLQLKPGDSYDLYLRITNTGTMILPITLSKPNTFYARALQEQMLQGLLTGLALCLLVYSLTQWLTLREPLYAKYALLITGSLLFSLLHFGIGSQYLWGGNNWAEIHMGGLSALIAATGSFLFNEQALAGPDLKPWQRRLMKVGAGVTAISAVLYAFNVIDVFVVTAIVSTIGLAPPLLAGPGAMARARRGDSVGIYFLVAWATYFISTFILIQVIKGRVDANFWTMHAFQIGATIDMLIFMRVLGLRTKALHIAVQHATLERDRLQSLVHTDPLTGLPNRRGLHAAVESAIQLARAEDMVAVYVLDLDGFKQINDQYGHDVGDELLIAVAQRLQSNVRSSDVISRLGGDEFVVMSCGLHSDQQARDIGEKLLKAFDSPFELAGQRCHIGLTAGYALAPHDGHNAIALIKCADAAMYEGKNAGKHCVRRGSMSASPA
ncbi:diguanylate cyclase [Rhodoferax sp.]|uniref:diguanylate cyclase n=1 Tax=Rhodoferax sp. TaxID=50421 RepID=UPI002ACD6C86|nr:diguanylate cyclase [Rhodoferax sp.]